MTATTKKHLVLGGTLLLLFSFLAFAAPISEAVGKTLALCGGSIIPSLFPYLVLSGLLVAASDGIHMPGGRLFSRVFGLPRDGITAFILGATCGFPVGAKTAAELYRSGRLSRDEAASCAALSANTGPAFAVAAIGGALFGSTSIGWLLYGMQILSAILLGVLARPREHRVVPSPPVSRAADGGEIDLPGIVSRASLSMLSVCGSILFFSALAALPTLLMPRAIAICVTALLEVSNGATAGAALPLPLGLPLTAFALSFSGLSVLLQSAAELTPSGIPVAPLMRRKLLQGALSALLALGALPFLT